VPSRSASLTVLSGSLSVVTAGPRHSEPVTDENTNETTNRPGGAIRSGLLAPRRRAWAIPAAAVVVVAAVVTIPQVAGAAPSLPPKSAAQLLAAVAKADAVPLSGTVVETARLGLPALPETGQSIQPTSLLAGSHTARVWYDGANKSRIALVANLAETDLVRNGRDVWLWTSGANTAQHAQLPAKSGATTPEATTPQMTPQEAAKQALAAIDPTTKVSVDGTASVAGRSAYELVLQPRDPRSLIGDVRIALDSKTYVPLRVQVHAAGATGRSAFETAFTSVSFSKPSASVFTFTPPPGAKVSTLSPGSMSSGPPKPDAMAGDNQSPKVVGDGWTAVLSMPGVDLASAAPKPTTREEHHRDATPSLMATLSKAMTPVSGSWGSGQMLRTKLVTVLLTSDGRLLVGAVTPATLEQAAGA
jgi:outer membrane lipoprotein-sorting protein